MYSTTRWFISIWRKIKLELTKKYYNLGNYIAKKYYNDKILDFSYDEEYKFMNEKIVSLKNYITKLKKNWYLFN